MATMTRTLGPLLTVLLAALPARGAPNPGDLPSWALNPADPASWELPHADLYALAVLGPRVWAVGYWGTALRSEDAGTTWSQVPTPTPATLYGVDFADAEHGWAVGAYGTLLRTTDGGRSWQPQTSGVDTHLFAVSAVSADEAWAVGDLGVVLHVRDATNWERVQLPEAAFADQQPLDRIFNGVRFSDPRHGWIVGEFATLLRSDDGGASWIGVRRIEGAPTDLYLYGLDADGARSVAAAGLAGSVLVSRDGGETWELSRTGSSAPMFDVSWAPPAGTAVGDRGELRTTRDAGSSWITPEHPRRLFVWLMAVRGGAGALYAVGEKGVVLRSRDGGASWVKLR